MIGKLLGHSQIQTTARYAHLARDSVQASAARVAASIGADILSEDSFAPPALGELPLATRVRIAAQHDGAALPRDTVAASAARIAAHLGAPLSYISNSAYGSNPVVVPHQRLDSFSLSAPRIRSASTSCRPVAAFHSSRNRASM